MPSTETAELGWRGYEPALLASYQRFAAACFGRHAYQAKAEYPAWLYGENPTTARAAADFLVGVDGAGEVVACVHKLRMPWRVRGADVVVPAVHNLMAAPAHRHGIGAMLILGSFARDAHALVPGVAEPLSGAYAKLGCERVETRWYRWVLDPLVGAARVGAGRWLGRAAPAWPMARVGLVARLPLGLRFETQPSEARCGELAEALSVVGESAAPRWNADVVRWRFFHPLGPRHLAVTNRRQDFLALVSLGRHRGARAARLVELRCEKNASLERELRALRTALFFLGADLLLAFSADPALSARLDALGAPRLAHPVDTYVYHRRRADHFAPLSFMGGVGDHGFEAI